MSEISVLPRFNAIQFTLLVGQLLFLDQRGSNIGNYNRAARNFSSFWIGGLYIGGEENRGANGEFSKSDRVAYS